jgi:four helix bundle protein
VIRNDSRGFKDLIAWQKADRLASLAYRACKDLPKGHEWLMSQILRCAVSVPANIAEGHGRGTKPQFLNFIDIARGSLSEFHFLRTEELLSEEKLTALDASRMETGRVIYGLWHSLKSLPQSEWDHSGKQISEESGVYSVS